MLEGIYTDERTIGRYHRSWLGEAISEYVEGFVPQGYRRITLQTYARILFRFGAFVEAQGVREIASLPYWVEPFIAQYKPIKCFQVNWRALLNRFIRHLRGRGMIPMPEPTTMVEPFAAEVSDYIRFISEHRGVSQDHALLVQIHCQAFLEYVRAVGIAKLSSITPQLIQSFITEEGKRYARVTMSSRCSFLRGFLSYLYLCGAMPVDLSSCVMAPRLYRHERCPRFLTRAQIQAVLSAVDRTTAIGMRDYAMLLLLATYGLRGNEVIRLRLDDIGWRNERLHVRRRKAGNSTSYPLAPSVGEAILCYLERARPCPRRVPQRGRQAESSHREIFLCLKAPFKPLSRTAALGCVVRRYLALAEVNVERPGTHTFRYSCAQMLLEDDFPIKTIGDYLGHRDPGSTHRYTMMALSALREVALGDGEEML